MSEHESVLPVSASRIAELEAAVSAYQEQVTDGVLTHLLDRGLSLAVAGTYRLGSVVEPLPGHEKYRGYMAYPYLGHDGSVLSLRFRCLEEHKHRDFGHGKYMSLPHEPARVFNVKAIHEAEDTIHIAEGEFDAITLCEAGLPAIAIPGASGWRRHHRRMVAGFSQVFVWGDPDEAGQEFQRSITASVNNAIGVRLKATDGDVSDLYRVAGQDALYERLGEVAYEGK